MRFGTDLNIFELSFGTIKWKEWLEARKAQLDGERGQDRAEVQMDARES